jgi:UDP-N-acetylmuramoyl-tripeptide--D-alanyl-D-alanine ligase
VSVHTAPDADLHLSVSGVSTDTRRLLPGQLFVALDGPRHSGEQFVADAARRRAEAAIVHRHVALAADITQIVVPCSRRALGALAAAHRSRTGCPWVAVTGSAGKTTTRDLIAHLLSDANHRAVLRPEQNFNNDIGLPLTILRARPEHEAAVVEIGTNAPGEIGHLAGIAQPDVAVITTIGAAHLQGLGRVEDVAQEKGDLLRALNPYGMAFVPVGVPHRDVLVKDCPAPIRTFGLSVDADIAARVICTAPGEPQRFVIDGAEFVLQAQGLHQVYNAVAAVAVARHLGLSTRECARRIEGFVPPAGRGRVAVEGGVTVIDDTYNANPVSFTAALLMLDRQAAPQQRVIVAGDMAELGDQTIHWHRHVGRIVAQLGARRLITVGHASRELGRAATQAVLPADAWQHFPDTDAAADALRDTVESGDTVLVKGSRSMRLEQLVSALQEQPSIRKAG